MKKVLMFVLFLAMYVIGYLKGVGALGDYSRIALFVLSAIFSVLLNNDNNNN